MKFDTETAARYAGEKLDSLLERVTRDTVEIFEPNYIPAAVTHFAEVRETVSLLAEKLAALHKHVDAMSYELLPTMFTNQDVRSIIVDGVGRATVNARWSASMLNKAEGMNWLRETGNDGIITETVHAGTLGAFAKERYLEGKPLPEEIFKAQATPHISLSKA